MTTLECAEGETPPEGVPSEELPQRLGTQCAAGGTRTHTSLSSPDPKSDASTNSATAAFLLGIYFNSIQMSSILCESEFVRFDSVRGFRNRKRFLMITLCVA